MLLLGVQLIDGPLQVKY